MPSINLDLDYFTHPKTTRLIGLLGRGAEVLPIRLWAYCGKYHSEDGKLAGYTDREIEAVCGWWGEPGKMVDAMIKCGGIKHGFLHRDDDGTVLVTNWLEHAGHIVAYRKRSEALNRAKRDKLQARSPCSSPCSSQARSPASSPPSSPNAMQCNAMHITPLTPLPGGESEKAQSEPENATEPEASTAPASGSKQARQEQDPVRLPENLQTPEFESAWERWKGYRKQRRQPLTKSTIEAQLKKFSGWGASKAAKAIDLSITNGWQGLFDPDVQRTGSNGSSKVFRDFSKASIETEGF